MGAVYNENNLAAFKTLSESGLSRFPNLQTVITPQLLSDYFATGHFKKWWALSLDDRVNTFPRFLAIIEAIRQGDTMFAGSHLEQTAPGFVVEADRAIGQLKQFLVLPRWAKKLLATGTMTNTESLNTVSELFLMRFFESNGELLGAEVPFGTGKDADLKIRHNGLDYLMDVTCALDPTRGSEQLPEDGRAAFIDPHLYAKRLTLETRVCKKYNEKFKDAWDNGAKENFAVAVDMQRFVMMMLPALTGLRGSVSFDSAYVFQQCPGLKAVLIFATSPRNDGNGLTFVDKPMWYQRP